MSNIKQIRKREGFTQWQVAEALSVSQGTVAMWEVGKSLPRAETLKRLAALFGVTVDELLAEDCNGKGA